MTQKVLFVCLGNICRSPSAEAVFTAKAAEAGLKVEVDSAGTANWHEGKPPYEPMQEAAAARGYDLSPLRARQFTVDDYDRFDLIVAMDDENMARLEHVRPIGNDTPLCLMMEFATDLPLQPVPDPYYTRDFNEALDLIEVASDGLVAQLSQ